MESERIKQIRENTSCGLECVTDELGKLFKHKAFLLVVLFLLVGASIYLMF